MFICGDRITQDSLYSWAGHAQLSCQLAEVTTAEGKDGSERTPSYTHKLHKNQALISMVIY